MENSHNRRPQKTKTPYSTKEIYGITGLATTGLGIASITTGLGIALSGCPISSLMIGTCALPTVLALTGAVITTIGGAMALTLYLEDNPYIRQLVAYTAILMLFAAATGPTLGYAAWHVGLSQALTGFAAHTALAIEAGAAFGLGFGIGSIIYGLWAYSRIKDKTPGNYQALYTGCNAVIAGAAFGLILAAATTLGPALSITLGAAGAEITAMECFIAIISMLLILPMTQLLGDIEVKGLEYCPDIP